MTVFIPKTVKSWVTRHLLPILFAGLFAFLGFIVVSTQTIFQDSWIIDKLAYIAVITLGFFTLMYVGDIPYLLLLATIGFFIGWLIRILWIKGKRAQIIILTAFLLNSICFILMFVGLLYIDD